MAEGVNDIVAHESPGLEAMGAEVALPDAPQPAAAPEPVQVEETSVIRKHFEAPALIPLERVEGDDAFLMRSPSELEDVSALATDIARLGQLFPIDVRFRAPDRFQIITGFRRVAALRFLQRERVLARLHADLSDADALLMALASAIHARSVSTDDLQRHRARLEVAGPLPPAVRDMFEKALASDSALGPEHVEEEVDADELAADVTVRLGQCNQDLSLLADVFSELEATRKEELLRQLRYSIDLVAFLESK